MPVHLVEVPALALMAFVVHHTRAGQCEQHRHDQVENTVFVRQSPEYIDTEPHERHNQENHGNSKVFLFIGVFVKLVHSSEQ